MLHSWSGANIVLWTPVRDTSLDEFLPFINVGPQHLTITPPVLFSPCSTQRQEALTISGTDGGHGITSGSGVEWRIERRLQHWQHWSRLSWSGDAGRLALLAHFFVHVQIKPVHEGGICGGRFLWWLCGLKRSAFHHWRLGGHRALFAAIVTAVAHWAL